MTRWLQLLCWHAETFLTGDSIKQASVLVNLTHKRSTTEPENSSCIRRNEPPRFLFSLTSLTGLLDSPLLMSTTVKRVSSGSSWLFHCRNVKGDVPMEGVREEEVVAWDRQQGEQLFYWLDVVIEEASNLLWGGRARPAKTPNYGFTSAGSGGAVYTILLCLPTALMWKSLALLLSREQMTAV